MIKVMGDYCEYYGECDDCGDCESKCNFCMFFIRGVGCDYKTPSHPICYYDDDADIP